MNIVQFLQTDNYRAYSYSYPHKNSYRMLVTTTNWHQAWHNEDKSALFLYVHIPFCEMRCGFCNLFTYANARQPFTEHYLQALVTQIKQLAGALGEHRFARLALGGGTPTILSTKQLAGLFNTLHRYLNLSINAIPVSCEVSPLTAEPDKLAMLYGQGVDRISIGIQSFFESENREIGRSQPSSQVRNALQAIRDLPFRALNVDLIYGIPGQTANSWLQTLRACLQYRPEEIYLYPLYIRPLTGIGRKGAEHTQSRILLYREGRDFLLSNGYRQVSMRMFQRLDGTEESGPVYRCQEDALVGLGAGARSYTRQLHYSGQYAINRNQVKEIIQDYIDTQQQGDQIIRYGFELNDDEQYRRYVILSLLSEEGLNWHAFKRRFGIDARDYFQQISELWEHDFAVDDGQAVRLTPLGVEHSDGIGPWFYSATTNRLVQACHLQ